MVTFLPPPDPNDRTPIPDGYFRIEKSSNAGEIIITDILGDIDGDPLASQPVLGQDNLYNWTETSLPGSRTNIAIRRNTIGGQVQHDFFLEITDDDLAPISTAWKGMSQTAFTTALQAGGYGHSIQMPLSNFARAVTRQLAIFGIEYSSQNALRDLRTLVYHFSKIANDRVYIHVNTQATGGFIEIYYQQQQEQAAARLAGKAKPTTRKPAKKPVK